MTYRGGPSETQLRFLQALGALRDVGYRGPLPAVLT